MSLLKIIYTALIGPLRLLFETVFRISYSLSNSPGISIFLLSIFINTLVLPLYKRADAMQEQARDMEEKLREGRMHIRKTFSGSERMMMLQTYYRQSNYSPANALKGSVSLLLEIPFFMAAYRFLSGLDSLAGVPFGPVLDLSAPDGLLVVGGVRINILPVVMTILSMVSGYIYLKGFPLKNKVQHYGMAVFFLVFLYNSPSGLVFYWTFNNIFSLAKTVILKYKSVKTGKGFNKENETAGDGRRINTDNAVFTVGSVFLAVLTGILIPSNVIAASPQEFADMNFMYNPLLYIVSSGAMAAGTFLIWMHVIYRLAAAHGRVFLERFVWLLCGIMFMNYMFFGTKLGNISYTLHYDNGMYFSTQECIINVLFIFLLAVIMYYIITKWRGVVKKLLIVMSMAVFIMSAVNVFNIKASVDSINMPVEKVSINLSARGKNVVIIMLDRAMGEYIPYIMNEKPELEHKFDGFTYYSNVISFGGYTNFGVPAMMGGYEYTPVEFNRRKDESLEAKHNEALKVMPVLFSEHGYDVTLCDPVYANYQWIPDVSIYDEYPDIDAYVTKGNAEFMTDETKRLNIENNSRNFFCFALMKTMPVFLQPAFYSDGSYNQSVYGNIDMSTDQVYDGKSRAQGIKNGFMESYETLSGLSSITDIRDESQNTFLFLSNDITHDFMMLKEPEYVPSDYVDNTEFDAANEERFTVGGRTIKMEDEQQMGHYQSNMAALIKLGEWFDFLREKGVYDNTRIIIVSDHGRDLGHFDELCHDNGEDFLKDVELYYPLLLVKDFNSSGFTMSDEFMTNADVPVIAAKGLIENPVNPFTGNLITNDEKTAHEQYVILSNEYLVDTNNGNTYLPARWARVKDNLWDKDNWEFYDRKTVLDGYGFPDEK